MKTTGMQVMSIDEFAKAEGARGGKILGHTKRGKPIYMTRGSMAAHMKMHSGFDMSDHYTAAARHADWAIESGDRAESMRGRAQSYDLRGDAVEAKRHEGYARTYAAESKRHDRLRNAHKRAGDTANPKMNAKKAYTTETQPAMQLRSATLKKKSKHKKCADKDMVKAEGSRGGKIIGHTRSGKPIYGPGKGKAQAHVAAHKDFTADDHHDAAEAHYKASEAAQEDHEYHKRESSDADARGGEKDSERDEHARDAAKFEKQMVQHANIADAHRTAQRRAGKVKKSLLLLDGESELRVPFRIQVEKESAMKKSLYGDGGWLSQFMGTDLFDDAAALCEEELALDEERIKSRASTPQPAPQNDGWEKRQNKTDALLLKKQKLLLRLAKQRNKSYPKMSKSTTQETNMSNGSEKLEDLFKAELDPNDVNKALFDCPHCDHPVTKAEVIEKARKKGKTHKAKDDNANGEAHRGPKTGMNHESVRPSAGNSKNDKVPPQLTKSEPEAPKPAANERQVHITGSEHVMYVDDGTDAAMAKAIEEGTLGQGSLVNRPIDNHRSPRR